MINRLYIKDVKTNELIEIFRLDSLRAELLTECCNEPNGFQNGQVLTMDFEKLRTKIMELISLRSNNPPIDFGNRFEYDQCYQRIDFEGLEYELETSGNDHLISFAMNIYNAKASEFLISDEQN